MALQPLDRAAPILPLRPGIPEKQTDDYKRNGTTSLFAALEVATGKVTDACYERHTNAEFLAFLKLVAKAHPRRTLHVVADNYATHSRPNVQAWLANNPRVTMHFTPTSGSCSEHGRDLLRDHHPASHQARHLRLRPRPQRRHPGLH